MNDNSYLNSYLEPRLKKLSKNNSIETVIIGLSYGFFGVIEKEIKKCIKLALPSQDIYYDYCTLEKIVNKNSNIKYCILSMAYYSFDFDLSLTSEVWRIDELYYPIYRDSHHHHNVVNSNIKIEKRPKSLEYLYEILNVMGLRDIKRKYWGGINSSFDLLSEENKKIQGKERANTHNKLDYPKTVIENKKIFIQTLELLKQNEIKPIIVVFPTVKYYSEFFSKDIKLRFYEILNELRNDFDFQIVDMFNNKTFNLSDFMDSDHLNINGAKKMTQILNDEISWNNG